jgi:hypothetical protein
LFREDVGLVVDDVGLIFEDDELVGKDVGIVLEEDDASLNNLLE